MLQPWAQAPSDQSAILARAIAAIAAGQSPQPQVFQAAATPAVRPVAAAPARAATVPPPPPGHKIVEFEGQRHEFPDDFTDQDIATALGSMAPPPRTGMFDDLTPTPAPAAEPVPETPPADADPGTWGEYAEGIAQKAAQGVLFNFGDEIAAGAGSVGNKVMRAFGIDVPERDYHTIIDEIRGQENLFTKANPKTALASEIGGALTTGIGTGATAARLLTRAGTRPGLMRSALAAGATAAPLGAASEVGKLEGDKSIGDYADAALEGGSTAAMFGTAIGGAGHSLARVVGPWATETAQRLADRGIRLTPGELLGSYPKKAEDITTSIPFVSAMVRNRRLAGVEDINREVANEVLEPIGRQVARDAPAGRELVRDVGDHITAVYQRVVPQLRGVWDTPLQRDIANITNTLPHDQGQTFNRFVNRELDSVTNGQGTGTAIAGEDVQHLIGTLHGEARHLITSPTASHHDRELGRAFGFAADAVEENMALHTPAAIAEEFGNANAAFERLVRLEKAAGSVGSDAGVFTPAQFLAAVKSSDRSTRKRAFARGESRMQRLADDAKSVMGQRIADSGTPERAAMIGAILAPAAALPAAMTALPLAALYTNVGNRAFQRAAAASPAARMRARQIIEQLTRAGAPAAGLAATTGG